MKNRIKNFIGHIGFPIFKILKQKQGVSSIIFHHIDRNYFSSFEKLINAINNELGFINPEDFALYTKGEYKINSKKVLLTFDDGFYSNYELSKEILDPINVKALFFVNPNFAKISKDSYHKAFMKDNFLFNNLNPNNSENIENPEIIPMKFKHMRDLIDNGHTIGSHSYSHQRLSSLSSSKILFEIVESKRILEEELLHKIKHFAFPFGDIKSISSEAMEIAKKHYEYIYSGIRGLNTLKIKRHAILRESLNISNNTSYNLLLSANVLSFKDRKSRYKLNNLITK